MKTKELTEDEWNLIKMGLDTMIETCKFSRGFGEKTKHEIECERLFKKLN